MIRFHTNYHSRARLFAAFTGYIILLAAFAGCVADPTAPSQQTPPAITTGVIVVNEGIWRQDNSTLTLYDPATTTATQDYFSLKNPGLRIGDVANSIQIYDGKAFIAVSTSQTIEVMELATGRSLAHIRLPEKNEPRQIAIVDSTTAYVTCFGDSIVRFNPATMTVSGTFAVGPAPEGIAYAAGKVLVSNSGYGYYRQTEPKAGTISVIDPATGAEERTVPVGPNPRQIRFLESQHRLFVLYGLPDSTGGVIELDPVSLKEVRRWPVPAAVDMAVDQRNGMGYVIGSDGVEAIDFNAAGGAPRIVIPATAWPRTTFYSLGVQPDGAAIYLGTYGYFTVPGEVLIFDRSGTLTGRFTAGLGPGDFGFY